MKALQVHKKNYLLLILFMSVLLAFQFPSFIRAESESAVETEKIISETPKESIPEKDVAQQTEEKKQAKAEEESIAETEPLPEEETLPEIDGVSTEEIQSESAEETEKAAESEQESDGDAVLNEEDEPKAETAKEEEPEEAEEPEVLKQGEVLEVDALAKEPMAFGAGAETSEKIVEVEDFDGLKKAIADAGSTKTTIKIMKSFTLTEALTIGKDQDITLTANNTRKEDPWVPIERPADYADQGEKTQREIIEEGRKRGEEALEKADLEKNPLPSEDSGNIIIKRAENFIKDTLFKVLGKLTLGTEDSAVYIDGNGDYARTAFDDKGSVIDVNGELEMKNAVIMNSYNKHGYTGPIRVNKGGKFTMEGGRISGNTSYEQIEAESSYPYAAGAVYVRPGGTFTMKNGLIDNNVGGMTGGVFAGDLSGSKGDPAVVNINGGIIAKNETRTSYQMGGGLVGFPASKVEITDGIIAGNKSDKDGGGIGISSQYVYDYSQVYRSEWSKVTTDYEKFITENKAEAKIDGGLIYKNKSGTNGGGVFVDSNDVTFGKTMILDNTSGNLGGGIYVSFPPITQKLKHILITENKAEGYTDGYVGGSNGGGIWNCPTGYVHIGDGHSVYVYNNNAGSYGQDITFVKKAWNFELNGKRVGDEFYSHISPVTEGDNIIKYVEDGRGREYGETIPGHLSYHTTYTYLKAIYNEALIKEAWKNSETFVLGNKARNGGGLGSNANLITEDKGEYQIEFNKKWDESVDKYHTPTTIEVDLFIVPLDKDGDYVKANYGKDNNLFKYGEIIIREKDNWYARFGTNDYNGANKDKVLEMLGIKSFTDIGLPKNAFNMDKGLPFTADELAKKGYKYLAVEQGTGYYVEVTEEKPTEDKTVEAGILEITRVYDSDPYYDDENVKKDKNLYFYVYDPDRQVLTRLGKSTIHEGESTPNVGKTTFAHPLLLKKVSGIKYYGKDRVFTEYGWDDEFGYYNEDKGFAIVLTENKDGTLTVELPYLWYTSYDENLGFSAKQLEETVDYEIKGNSAHSFTLTNSNWGQLDVEKSWTNIEEKDQPESMDFYLLLDGKRIVDGYDENGKPIYKKLTLKAKDEWKGTFKKLNPKALAAGKYTLEENSDIFAPEFINKKEKFIIRIGYADHYREEGMAENQITSTNNHFPSENYKNEDGTYRDVKLNLYVDGEKVQEGVFHFTVRKNPITGAPYAELKKTFAFDAVEVETYGQGIPVKYYDFIGNETGREEYNFYLKKDEHGAYALYLPSLFYKGVSYSDLFIAESLEYNERYDRYDKITFVNPLKADEDWQIKTENHYGPIHNIEILKKWIDGEDQIPDEITVLVRDENGKVQEIKLTKEDNWQKTIENLQGTLRKHGYSISEVDVPGFTGEVEIEKTGLKITGKGEDGKEITLDYMTPELKRVLAKGNYRYEVFELSEEDKKEFNRKNINTFIKVEKQKDGRYIIRYAKGISLTEILAVNVANTYIPPETPPGPNTRIIIVKKQWALEDGSKPADKVIVELYRDGKPTGKRMELSAANNWTGEFRDLEIADKSDPTREYLYTIREVGESNGSIELDDKKYDVIYAGDMVSGFTITNKEVPPEEPPEEPPETPEVPPETPEVPPETPPVIPPNTPKTPPKKPGSPQTGVDGVSGAFALMSSAAAGLFVLQRKKKED